MLLKLLKYEFKSTAALLYMFAAYAAAAGLLLWLRPGPIGHYNLPDFLTFLCMLVLFIALFTTLFQRFSRNLFGNEGYLMLTLPVRGAQLLLSKLIAAVVWGAAYFAVLSVTVNAARIRFGTDSFEVSGIRSGQIAPALMCIFALFLFAALTIYLSVTVSKLTLWRRAGTLAGIVCWFAAQFLLALPFLALIFIERLGAERTAQFVKTMRPLAEWLLSWAGPQFFYWAADLYILLLDVALFFLTSWLLDRHISLR